MFAEASFAESKSHGALVDAFSFGDVVITPDNPYLPANVAAIGAPVVLFRTFEEFPPITSVSHNKNVRLVGGLEGKFGESFKWEVSGQYGETKFSNDQPYNLLVGNLILAADAVVDPSTDEIVCRANLGGANGAPGCVPVNLFGKGSPSQAAIDYFTGTGTSDTEDQADGVRGQHERRTVRRLGGSGARQLRLRIPRSEARSHGERAERQRAVR